MIRTEKPKQIRVMMTAFRDGLQSAFGGKVRLADFLEAVKLSSRLGIRHFEFGGGARYQAPYFYLGEDPFADMQAIRDAVGPDADLQILTRSVSGVTLTTQSLEALRLQAKLMKKHGTTWDRNFDYMNDVRNLINTARPIVEAGMHHQACVALMGLPFVSDRVHTSGFYIDIARRLLAGGVRIDSLCLKDASGTCDPRTVYETAVGVRKLMPPEMPLWIHTHDTASMAVACYMAGIEGGADGIDLSVRPLASGTVQPDVRSMAHALKGTGYSLDIDPASMNPIEECLTDLLKDYAFNPATTTADARVVGFPMPGGAIGPNVHMMVKAGILEKYGEVLAEFPVVVEAGGAWTSVTPGSQQYWLQAFNNVLYGRWERIEDGYARAVLGYFGKTPLPPDPMVVKKASEELELPPFDGDPLEAAPNHIVTARSALAERGLPVTDENVFLVLSAIVPGMPLEMNEGIRLLTGKPKIDVPLKKKGTEGQATPPAPAPAAPVAGPTQTRCTVEENGRARVFTITLEPAATMGLGAGVPAPAPAAAPAAGTPASAPPSGGGSVAVRSPFGGRVEVVGVSVKVGDHVKKGQTVAAVEAMKAKHDIRAPVDGVVVAVNAAVGQEIDSTQPILVLS